VESAEKREHPHIYLWLKTKLEIIAILFYQKRFEDCADAIAVTRLECQVLNDLFFARQLMEVEFMVEVYRGEIETALKTAEKIRKHAQTYHQNDVQFANFLGNLSELMYNRDRRAECNDVVKEGRLIVWYKLRDYGLDLDPQNINAMADVKVNKLRLKVTEDVLAPYQTAVAQPGAKPGAAGAKPAAQAKAAGAKGQPQVPEDLPVEEEKAEALLDFSQKVDYQLVLADVQANSSHQEPNIYLRCLDAAVRFDTRYAQYLSYIEKKHDLAKKILTDSEKLIKRTLHVSPQLKFYVNFLLGHANLQIFYDKLVEFQAKYEVSSKYKQSFQPHVPYGGVALAQYMVELPNFSENLKKFYKDYLEWAKRSLRATLDAAKTEAVMGELDLTLVDCLRDLAEVSFLVSEYRARVLGYKWAKYQELDVARKVQRKIQLKKEQDQVVDDNLLVEEVEREVRQARDEWEEQKANKEKLDIVNHRKAAVHYMELCVAVSKA